MVNYRPKKFLGLLAPTQYAGVNGLSPAFRVASSPGPDFWVGPGDEATFRVRVWQVCMERRLFQ